MVRNGWRNYSVSLGLSLLCVGKEVIWRRFLSETAPFTTARRLNIAFIRQLEPTMIPVYNLEMVNIRKNISLVYQAASCLFRGLLEIIRRNWSLYLNKPNTRNSPWIFKHIPQWSMTTLSNPSTKTGFTMSGIWCSSLLEKVMDLFGINKVLKSVLMYVHCYFPADTSIFTFLFDTMQNKKKNIKANLW